MAVMDTSGMDDWLGKGLGHCTHELSETLYILAIHRQAHMEKSLSAGLQQQQQIARSIQPMRCTRVIIIQIVNRTIITLFNLFIKFLYIMGR